MANCERVVEIIQIEFGEGRLPMECVLKTVVLIPKGNGQFRGIGLVEVL